MFFFWSKVLLLVFNPLLWGLALLVYALYTTNQKRRLQILRLSLAAAVLLTNPGLPMWFLQRWEGEVPRLQDLAERYEYGIVLTGITVYKQPDDRVYFSRGADRLLHALWLYRQGRIRKILITGGTTDIFGQSVRSEAERLAEVLALAEVPPADILIEPNARNTYENAQLSAQILQKAQATQQTHLLITSAFHLPRATACFRKAGLDVMPFGTDFYTPDRHTVGAFAYWVPSLNAPQLWQVLLKEWLGFAVYRMSGYL
jgi:uncharacterized SAM-binding protein YcdF (DUF218 family)